jgi:probable HAF family extracellular repeat protein
MRASALALLAVLPAVTGRATAAAGSMHYDVVDLGVINRLAADVVPGLSHSGNTVIWHRGEAQTFEAILRVAGRETHLLPPKGFENGFAYSVNDRGDAVGWSNTTANPIDSASVVHATYFGRHGARDLGTLGGRRSRAYAINDREEIVGMSELADGTQRAFRYQRRMQVLETLPGGSYSVAFDLNGNGLIVGGSGVAASGKVPKVHAVLWREGRAQDLGTLEADGNSLAYAVNESGDVTGVSDRDSEESVFLFRDGVMRDLDIRGHAFGINRARDIVGTLAPPERSRPRGFVWRDGTVHDLNDLLASPAFRIEAAYRINDRGQILCSGVGPDNLHALLLNPRNR